MCAFFGVESSNGDLLLQAGLLLGVCLLFLAVVPPQFREEEQVRDHRYRLYVGVLLGTLAIGAMFVVFSLQISILAISATVFVAGTRTVVWDIRRPSPGHQFEGVGPSSADAVEPGVVEVEGTVRPVDEAGTAPLSERPYVASAWRVDEWNHVQNSRGGPLAVGGGNWFTPANGVTTVPFEIVGDDARIEVVAEEPSVVDETGAAVVEVAYDETPPDSVSRFLSERDVPPARDPPWDNYDVGNRVQGDRKYVEAAIEPGDDVYVHGRARERSDGSLVLEGREDCEHELVVSRHRKRRTVRTLTRSSRVAIAGWLGAALGGFTVVTMVVVEVVL